ncbi:hypothetical protein niasHT_004880 [Heterodera trifolii]|uniref:Ubiquitin-like protease family profile domain-containing protein n=1 Tax=Heterodera trifolii TaxID=157864 RepID=A0ABD2LR88_9BILA
MEEIRKFGRDFQNDVIEGLLTEQLLQKHIKTVYGKNLSKKMAKEICLELTKRYKEKMDEGMEELYKRKQIRNMIAKLEQKSQTEPPKKVSQKSCELTATDTDNPDEAIYAVKYPLLVEYKEKITKLRDQLKTQIEAGTVRCPDICDFHQNDQFLRGSKWAEIDIRIEFEYYIRSLKVQGNNAMPKREPSKQGATNQQQNMAGREVASKFTVPTVHYSYFLALKAGTRATNLVDKWVREYEESPDQAIVQLLQLIVASCGCSGKLDANMIHNMQWKDIVERLSEYFDEDSGDYPLTTQQYRKFRIHRYRDQVADVRIICISELGVWIRIYPALFLDDSFLQGNLANFREVPLLNYIGWSLFDKVAEVRQNCIHALLPLYENNDLIAKLESFTSQFKARLVSMVLDTDVDVATKTYQLMTHIYRAFPALLDPDACVPLYELVYCNNRQLATAAGEFVNAKLFSSAVDNSLLSSSTSLLTPPADNHQLIKNLVTFFIDAAARHHPAYLVDSLIDICPMLKDWSTMVNILLSDESDHTHCHLISIMCAAVRQAATGEHPPNRIVVSIRRGPGAGTEKKDLQILHDGRVHLSKVFIPKLPRLLQKFIADQEKVRDFIGLFLHFELEIYSVFRHDQPLYDLMKLLEHIVEQYSNDEITSNIASVFQFISTNMTLARSTETNRCRIVNGIVQNLRQQLQMFLANKKDEDQQLDEKDEAALLSAFRKMVAFASRIDVPVNVEFWDMCIALFQNSHRFRSAVLVEKAMLLCILLLNWEMKRLMATQEHDEETIESLKKKRDQLLRATKSILRDFAIGVETAFMCICDILILFNRKLAADNGPDHTIHSLAIKLDDDMAIWLNAYSWAKSSAYLCKGGFFTEFGDIIKNLFQKCLELDKRATAKAIVRALVSSYNELRLIPQDTVDHESGDSQALPNQETIVDQDSEHLRELAKRLALSFGVDSFKNKEALAVIHYDGIKFALGLDQNRKKTERTYPNLSFFEILQEFLPKLHHEDKAEVLRYLDQNCSPCEQLREGEAWQTYQSSIQCTKPLVTTENKVKLFTPAKNVFAMPEHEKLLPARFTCCSFWLDLKNDKRLRSGEYGEWVKGQNDRLTFDGLLCLSDGQWLTADIIDCYLDLICRCSPRANFIPTYVILSYKRMGKLPSEWYWQLAETDIIFAPAHLNNNHWAMAILDKRERTLRLMDSINHGYTDAEKIEFMGTIMNILQGVAIKQKVDIGDRSAWDVQEQLSVPQQTNGIDCGIFALLFAQYSLESRELKFQQRHIPYFRRRICHDIISEISHDQ